MDRFESARWPAIPTSTTGPPMSARARCASCLPSTCSRPIPISARPSSSPRASRRATGVKPALEKLLRDEFVGTDAFVKPLELGPPVGRPVQYRVGGPDIQTVRELAQQVRRRHRRQSAARRHRLSTGTSRRGAAGSTCCRTRRASSASPPQDIASALNSVVGGATITQVRDAIYLIDVVGRAARGRARLDRDAAEPAAADRQRPGRPARRRRHLPLRARTADRSGGATACRRSPCGRPGRRRAAGDRRRPS